MKLEDGGHSSHTFHEVLGASMSPQIISALDQPPYSHKSWEEHPGHDLLQQGVQLAHHSLLLALHRGRFVCL